MTTVLTEGNYFSPEVAGKYMSASQVKSFMACEAMTMAEMLGWYQREETTPLLVGGYVDAYFSNTLGQYVAEHPQIYTRTGTLRAEFSQAQDIIARIESDPLMLAMLKGQAQPIFTGEIEGVAFRGKLDSLLNAQQVEQIMADFPDMRDTLLMADGAIVDLKIMRDMKPAWIPGRGRISFIEAWRYDLQLAIYQQLVGGKLPCFIACATKEKECDLALIHIPQYMLDAAIESMTEGMPRFRAVKAGEIKPLRCEQCNYCRRSRIISGCIDADELGEVE